MAGGPLCQHHLTTNSILVAPLQEYVLIQFRRLAASLAQELKPDTTEEELDLALSRALYRMGAQDRSAAPSLQLKYWHSCK